MTEQLHILGRFHEICDCKTLDNESAIVNAFPRRTEDSTSRRLKSILVIPKKVEIIE